MYSSYDWYACVLWANSANAWATKFNHLTFCKKKTMNWQLSWQMVPSHWGANNIGISWHVTRTSVMKLIDIVHVQAQNDTSSNLSNCSEVFAMGYESDEPVADPQPTLVPLRLTGPVLEHCCQDKFQMHKKQKQSWPAKRHSHSNKHQSTDAYLFAVSFPKLWFDIVDVCDKKAICTVAAATINANKNKLFGGWEVGYHKVLQNSLKERWT